MMVGRMDLVTGLVYSTQAMQEEDPEERMRLIAAGSSRPSDHCSHRRSGPRPWQRHPVPFDQGV